MFHVVYVIAIETISCVTVHQHNHHVIHNIGDNHLYCLHHHYYHCLY